MYGSKTTLRNNIMNKMRFIPPDFLSEVNVV